MRDMKTAAAVMTCLMALAASSASAQERTTPAAPPASEQPAAADTATGSDIVAAEAEGGAIAAARSLAPNIQDVQVVGPWTEEGRGGIWRTIMMRSPDDPDAYRFFVQQIEESNGTLAVRETTEITEMAEIDGVIVGYRADEPSGEEPSGLTLFFDILPSGAEISETYELHFFQDAPYMFGTATN